MDKADVKRLFRTTTHVGIVERKSSRDAVRDNHLQQKLAEKEQEVFPKHLFHKQKKILKITFHVWGWQFPESSYTLDRIP